MTATDGTRELSRRLPPAGVVEAMGWGVGTRLVGDEGYGPTIIQITAVGEKGILAKAISHDGVRAPAREANWTLAHRDWKEVKP